VFVVGKAYVTFQLPSKTAVVAELTQNEKDINVMIQVKDPAFLPVVRLGTKELFRSK
jgi:hypothetical protein